MTTITIERALLDRCVDKLLTCWPKSDPLINEIRATLAAPATVPDDRLKELEAELAATEIAIAEYRQQCLDNAAEIARLKAEPERKPTTDDQCVELFHKVQRGMGFKDQDVIPFTSGIAAAEHFHGIKEGKS